MIIKNRYKLFKKDLNYFDNYYYIQVYDMQEKDYFTISHRCIYIYYSRKTRKEIEEKVFNIFVTLLKDEFGFFTKRMEFIDKNNLTIDYN